MAIYKTAKGKEIDMSRLTSQHETTVAVSNVKINARGDELGPGGQIIRKQPDVAHVPSTNVPVEHQSAPVVEAVIKQPVQTALITPAPVVETLIVTDQPVVTDLQKPINYKGKQ